MELLAKKTPHGRKAAAQGRLISLMSSWMFTRRIHIPSGAADFSELRYILLAGEQARHRKIS